LKARCANRPRRAENNGGAEWIRLEWRRIPSSDHRDVIFMGLHAPYMAVLHFVAVAVPACSHCFLARYGSVQTRRARQQIAIGA
jgi:hypothetical protein